MKTKQSTKILVCYTAKILSEIYSKQFSQAKINNLVIDEVQRSIEKMKERVRRFVCVYYKEECILSGWAIKSNEKVIAVINQTHPPFEGKIRITKEGP